MNAMEGRNSTRDKDYHFVNKTQEDQDQDQDQDFHVSGRASCAVNPSRWQPVFSAPHYKRYKEGLKGYGTSVFDSIWAARGKKTDNRQEPTHDPDPDLDLDLDPDPDPSFRLYREVLVEIQLKIF